MPDPFTPPAGAAWQALLDELTIAWSERRRALGQSAYTPEAGRDVQDAAYWTAMQTWLETYCTAFVDHLQGPLNEAQTGFRMFTQATWRAAAGLPADGFRRATEWDGQADPDWAYGRMAAGVPADIIGPWIFEDLQRGLSALRWTIIESAEIAEGQTFSGSGDTIAETNADYALSSGAPTSFYQIHADVAVGTGGAFRDNQQRHLGKPKLSAASGFTPFLPSAKVIYGVPATDIHNFLDIDSLGLIGGCYHEIAALDESSAEELVGPLFCAVTTAPFIVLDLSEPPVPTGGHFCGFSKSAWLLKWNYTHQGIVEEL